MEQEDLENSLTLRKNRGKMDQKNKIMGRIISTLKTLILFKNKRTIFLF